MNCVSLPQLSSAHAAARGGADRLAATRNPCHLCAPLGASLVFKGIAGAVPLLHGSQGCSTYIRRYLISHFREPIDIASSNFSEASAIFGGKSNLHAALANVTAQYNPTVISVATTCLSETIGDDVPQLLRQHGQETDGAGPELVHASTPSYAGTHVDGFHAAVRAVIAHFAPQTAQAAPAPGGPIALFPNLVSPADLRHLKELVAGFGLPLVLVPDYSDTLDGPAWTEYQVLPPGGTPLAVLRQLPTCRAAIAFTSVLEGAQNPAEALAARTHAAAHSMALPIGVQATDTFLACLADLAGRVVPEAVAAERGRLVDACIDAHKYLTGRRVALVGDPDLLLGLTSFVREIGMLPVVLAPNGAGAACEAALQRTLDATAGFSAAPPTPLQQPDFATLTEVVKRLHAAQPIDLIIGSSKAFPLARELGVPLMRVGFPIHDRFGAQRLLHVGYRGAMQLLDGIVNTLLQQRQGDSDIGYAYM